MSAVVVAGALANKPGSSGEAWVRMSWVRGLASLGLDVWFVEQLGDPGGPRSRRARLVSLGHRCVRPQARAPRC